jgi:CelD/BcsL family acetyltransferase involved in cellulose biosynthesis
MILPADAWERWRADACATPFQSPAWIEPWWRHLGEGREPVVVAAGSALLPLFAWVDGGTRRLVPMGAATSDYLGGIGDPAELWPALGALDWDELLLPDLPPGSPWRADPPAGWTVAERPHETCPVLTLAPGTPLGAQLSKSRRRKLVHDRHRADRLGGVVAALAGPGELDEGMDALFRLHDARWQAAGEPGVLAAPAMRAFLAEAARRLDEAGLLRLALVRHDGRIVAALLGFCDGRAGYSYINGVDMTVPGQSFGTLAFACLIEAAIAEGAGAFHFLRGAEPYKYALGAVDTRTVRRTIRRR